MIEVNDLRKQFGKVVAVEDVSFLAPDGMITGLLGPNGAGKSTTLRMIYGLVTPASGQAKVDGIDSASDPTEVRKKLGALPDAHGLYPRLSARENIAYFGRLHGLSGKELAGRITGLVEELDMHDIIDRRVAGFSQGQRMKVSIARAIVHNPKNVILDEPTNGLDVMTTRAMRKLILQMKNEGRCVLFSSHIMQEVAALCDHVVIISAGRVRFSGTLDTLREMYPSGNLEDAFVAIIEKQGERS